MTITLLTVGKTDFEWINNAVNLYAKRINVFAKFLVHCISDIKNAGKITINVRKELEGKQILANINEKDFVVLLDERGVILSSVKFAEFIDAKTSSSIKNLVFVIGGPYGFSADVYNRANYKISLSPMTFSHQLVRVIFAEQLYRAFTIIKGLPYHHE